MIKVRGVRPAPGVVGVDQTHARQIVKDKFSAIGKKSIEHEEGEGNDQDQEDI